MMTAQRSMVGRRGMLALVSIGAVCVLSTAGGCAISVGNTRTVTKAGSMPVIGHPVFFTLKDPSRASELVGDCDRLLEGLSEVHAYHCGTPYDSGRSTVVADYHVGLWVGFASREAYNRYVASDEHQRLVEKWGPLCESIVVRDVLDVDPG